MGMELAIIEPIALPDQRRPTAMPSLPAWVESQLASLKGDTQKDEKTGRFRTVPSLPKNLLPTPDQRQRIAAHIRSLQSLLDQTPANSADYEGETLIVVTKMLMVLGGHKATAESSEAKGEAYTAALDDIPTWAVQSAMRRWHRADCGLDEQGEPYNYKFAPAPADLRRISVAETWKVQCRVVAMNDLLSAVERIEYSDEHCAKMVEGLQQAVRLSVIGGGKA